MRILVPILLLLVVTEAAAIGWLVTRPVPAPLEAPTPVAAPIPAPTPAAPVAPVTATGPSAPGPAADLARLTAALAGAQAARATAERQTLENLDRVRSMKDELHRLRLENEGLRQFARQDPRAPESITLPGPPDAELDDAQAHERAAKLASLRVTLGWTLGQPLPDQFARDLELTADQRQAVDEALAAEPGFLDTTIRDFIRREFPDDPIEQIETRSASELVGEHLGVRMRDEWRRCVELSGKETLEVARGRRTVREILGEGSRLERLATACEQVRRDRTWAQLARVLAPGQLRLVQERHLPLGSYQYPQHRGFTLPRATRE